MFKKNLQHEVIEYKPLDDFVDLFDDLTYSEKKEKVIKFLKGT